MEPPRVDGGAKPPTGLAPGRDWCSLCGVAAGIARASSDI